MKKKAVRVDVDSLKVGMYVAALDRPWLETPFLFQGFLIRDEEDIGALRRHCAHVYVDPEESANDVDFGALTPPRSPPRAQRAPMEAATAMIEDD